MAARTWGPENVQELAAPGYRWPLPTEFVNQVKAKTNRKLQEKIKTFS
jgi:hypothetical protein